MITTEVLKKELQSKQRSINDLFRYIKTRNDENPNYSLLLGSGCSVTSGIRSGGKLIEDWRKDIYSQEVLSSGDEYISDSDEIIKYLALKCGTWYNKNNEYSSLFEKQYDTPRQRRMFVEQEVSDKKPSIGYAYLMKLIENSFFKTIFTTNFDDLINEAFYQFSEQRPMVCAHDSSIKSITVTSKRPKIIKLHGDYLYDDIKSTLRETESLEDNIRNKFIEFAKDYGLIVVGYGGHDRSIMDVINYLLKLDDYYKHGVYWCLRKGDIIGEELRKLLWKENVYFVIIDGFDELFAELHFKLYGDELPISTNFISNKSQEIIESFINNDLSKNTTSNIIKLDLKRLEGQNEKNNLYDLIKEIQSNQDLGDGKFDNKETKLIMELENLYQQYRYDEILKKINLEVEQTNNLYLQINLYRKCVNVYIKQEKNEDAIKILNKLIEIDSKTPGHIIKKSKLEDNYDQKIALIDQAIALDEYDEDIINQKASYIIKQFNLSKVTDEDESKIITLLDKSIEINPSIENDAWDIKFRFLQQQNDADPRLKDIILILEKQKPYSITYLSLKYEILQNDTDKQKFIDNLEEIKNKFSPDIVLAYEILILNVLDDFNDKKKIKMKLDYLSNNKLYNKKEIFIRTQAKLLLSKFNELDKSIDLASSLFKQEPNSNNMHILITYLLCGNYIKEAQRILDENTLLLRQKEKLEIQKNIFRQGKDYVNAYEISKKLLQIGGNQAEKDGYIGDMAYALIQQEKYPEAKQILKELLDRENYNYKLESYIINYEFISKKQNNSFSKQRLEKILNKTKNKLAKAAIYILEDKQSEALSCIKEALIKDYSKKYEFQDWPIFKSLHENKKYQEYTNQIVE